MTISDAYFKMIAGIELAMGYFLNPNKRIYFLFLISSLLIAFFVFLKAKRRENFAHYIFNPKVWWGASPRVDYGLLVFNGVFKVVMIAPFIIWGLYISFYTKEFFLNQFGYISVQFSSHWIIAMYTVTLFVVKDLSSYLVHLVFHKVLFLWRFHKVHHSATVLNPLTQYRIHPVELLANNLKGFLVFGVITGFFDFLSNGNFHLFEVIGVNVFGFVFMFLGANLRHSHVKFKYPEAIENWLISPVQHQIHHSDHHDHYDRNLGSVLAVWDRIFGTLIRSKNITHIRFGLGPKENEKLQTFWQNLMAPFLFNKG